MAEGLRLGWLGLPACRAKRRRSCSSAICAWFADRRPLSRRAHLGPSFARGDGAGASRRLAGDMRA